MMDRTSLQAVRCLPAECLHHNTAPALPATLAQIEELIAQDNYAVLPVTGDCMAGAGIDSGDLIGVCFTRFPMPPKYKREDGCDRRDACLCWMNYQGRSFAGVKEYLGVWGSAQLVGTRYKYEEGKPLRMNWSVFAKRIFGVVFACWDSNGRLKWRNNPDDYPERLGTVPTIHGDNIGDPQPITPDILKAFEQKGRAVE